ncbi:MAG: DUF4389 domain-containing protein [Gammaproteobacteria bacterium]|nr:DUF4389 domain-containing protein [Gammaproteobacteria bacterium]MYH45406.1 DUF4389 domain-containing protein [Gammaproteobacteria bacterium]MYL12619.1 DUF4389 domain-containing protein [Gammaproteobacteria bacterium]
MSENSNASPWKDPAIWGRVVFVVLFLLIFALIVGPLAIILGVVQAVFTIFTGEENRNLRGLAAALAEYVREILLFASWNREQRPFPFSEFPRVAELEDTVAADEEETASGPETVTEEAPAEEEAPKAPPKKATRKKTSSSKAAADKSKS